MPKYAYGKNKNPTGPFILGSSDEDYGSRTSGDGLLKLLSCEKVGRVEDDNETLLIILASKVYSPRSLCLFSCGKTN